MKLSIQHFFFGLVGAGIISLLSCAPDPKFTPETCDIVREQAMEDGETPANGSYTLYVDGDETKPWEAYCHLMDTESPKEYLVVDETNNYSQISVDPNFIQTSFTRYRIDPVTLVIDLLDDTFAETVDTDDMDIPDGAIPDGRDHLPVGYAQFGNSTMFGGATASAKIDLTDTGFAFSENVLEPDEVFCTVESGGDSSASIIDISADLTNVTLTATNTIPSAITKTVTDCDHLSVTDTVGIIDFTQGTLALQYVVVAEESEE